MRMNELNQVLMDDGQALAVIATRIPDGKLAPQTSICKGSKVTQLPPLLYLGA